MLGDPIKIYIFLWGYKPNGTLIGTPKVDE